jgi:hypothetical protein
MVRLTESQKKTQEVIQNLTIFLQEQHLAIIENREIFS